MFPTALFLLFLLPFSTAIKFALPPAKIPAEKCIWNAAHPHALVIVTANVGPGPSQRIDIDIIDSTPQRNVYLSKKDINGETRLAVTAHAEGEIGVCFKNYLAPGLSSFFVVGLCVERGYRCQDGDWTKHDAHDRPGH